ncbi:hypothetical protein PQR64_35810 [Paraburkholderia phytofirmans]|uniref:hypothetical protein n=1 Tax=Paraburkholderia TaxID=1822464 RepID=UPI0038B858F5
MEKDAVIARIEEDLGRRPEVRRACVEIVDYLSRKDTQKVNRVTFGQLGRIAGIPEVVDILPVVEYLSGGRLHLLDPRFEFIDADNDFIEEVSVEEVAQARHDAVFYHPGTGEPVKDFERSLFMFFVLSEDAHSLGGAQ